MHTVLFPMVLLALTLSTPVAGHCKITSAQGDLGGAGTALGITANSGNSESDVTVFSGAQAASFGETPGGGNIDPATALPAAMAIAGTTLPQVSAGGAVTMNLHQVNADGAGPFTCSVDTTAQGTEFSPMTVTTNVAGTKGISTAANADFPLVASMPANATCTGTVAGVSGLCMVKCENPVGPFGGTVAVQMAAAAAGNATVGASPAPAAPATPANGGKKGKKSKRFVA
ncbi:hypothetical protein MMC17_000611 [Xylographa soralifera]|nr:hypothetical protein [Xylographa soralifera]